MTNRYWQALWDSGPDAIMIVENDCIVDANSKAWELLGSEPENLIGASVDSLFVESAESVARYEHPVRGLLNLRFKQTDNVWFVSEVSKSEAELAAKLKEARRELSDSKKREGLGRLAACVAHDFNNTLSPVLAYSELLMGSADATAESRELLQMIVDSALQARVLTSQLLAVSRGQTLQLENVELGDFLHQQVRGWSSLLRDDVELQLEISTPSQQVQGDRSQLRRVIDNLVLNAQDAMSGEGRIWVSLEQKSVKERMSLGRFEVEAGEYAVIAVCDDGEGMTADVVDQLFEPYFTTKAERGFGLGLASVEGIVEQHNGSIWVYSEPGRGSTFKIYLPLAQVTNAPAPDGATDYCDCTVLVVEDDDRVRDLCIKILDRNGCRVEQAKNGAEALRLLGAKSLKFDVLLTDMALPDTSGTALAETARRLRPGIRILCSSGFGAHQISAQGRSAGSLTLLEKPFSASELVGSLNQVLQGS